MSIAGIFSLGGGCGYKDRHHYKKSYRKDHYSYGGYHGRNYKHYGYYKNYYYHDDDNDGLLSGLL